jgi:hypothetical protein
MFSKTTDSKLDQAASKAGKAKPSPQEYPEEKRAKEEANATQN